MAKQRKSKSKENDVKSETTSSKPKNQELLKKISIGIVFTGIILYYYLKSRYPAVLPINTPLAAPHAVTIDGVKVPDRYWGTYRPGLYFGTKTRVANALETGLIWFKHELVNQRLAIRHWCDQGNKLPKYGWTRHDGVNFGEQDIVENGFYMNTTFVKRPGGSHGGDWSARISVTPRNKGDNVPISLMYYVTAEIAESFQFNPSVSEDEYLSGIQGISNELGRFMIKFPGLKKSSIVSSSFLAVRSPGLHTMSDMVEQMVLYNQKKKQSENPGAPVKIGLPGHVKLPNLPGEPNLFIHEITIIPPHDFEVTFESESNVDRTIPLSGDALENSAKKYRAKFDDKFEKTFGLKAKGFKENEQNFAKAAMSNMIGGIGYFYGNAIVQSSNSYPVLYWPTPLYTAVPSRSFFPRGFLWDEGFHNLLISQWNKDISKDIINHWMDLMNIEGWIPREVILGNEAQARVPPEFIIQKNDVANPPTFFLTIHSLLKHMKDKSSPDNMTFLRLIFPRLQAIYDWMSKSQQGKRPGTFYWRGRNQTAFNELNPKTLASGLDDYPRASDPDDDEAHLDLRCWMALASSVLADIAKVIGKPHEDYSKISKYLTDNKILDSIHWSEEHQRYLDYGRHSDDVKLTRGKSPPSKPGQRPQKMPKSRHYFQPAKLQHVNNFGYVSLFPFLLQIVKPNSPKLEKILNDITNADLLWTKFGLRSLSKDSPVYMKRNTEHDPPYWRGPVWININFLAVRALHHYSNIDGPYKNKAEKIYQELRSNIIQNIIREYERTGYIWEQYNDRTGEGQGVHPFTGWSALVVLMMSETY